MQMCNYWCLKSVKKSMIYKVESEENENKKNTVEEGPVGMLRLLDQNWERIVIAQSTQLIQVDLAFTEHWVQRTSEKASPVLSDLLQAVLSGPCACTSASVLQSITQSTTNLGVFHLYHKEKWHVFLIGFLISTNQFRPL